MKCYLLLVTVFIIHVKAAPVAELRMQTNQLDQMLLNEIAQESMEKWILQNQYNSMQHQLMAMQYQQAKTKAQYSAPPVLTLPQQPLLILVPSGIAKTTNQIKIENEKSNFKHGDADTVVINAESELDIPDTKMLKGTVVVLPNGQRLIIGSIISAIPFLPFEVNVPDTIGWIYNGISGIIGGIGQRLPFRPKPTTESPVQQSQESMPSVPEPMTQNQGSTLSPDAETMPVQEIKLMQKLLYRNPNGYPIIMLPVAQTVSI